VIDSSFGIKLRIKNSTSSLVTSCSDAVEVELNSMTIPFLDGSVIMFSRRIRKLIFSNIVVAYNLVSFLRACSDNLKFLSFGYIVLDQPISDSWESLVYQHKNEPISLPQLTTLEFRSLAFSDAVLEMFNFLADRVTFGALEDVIIQSQNPAVLPLQLIFSRAVTSTTLHPLLRILRNNIESLRKFAVGRSNVPTLLKFHPRTIRPENNLPVPEDEWEPPQLQHIEIHPYFREEWAPLLRRQNRIEDMRMGSCNVSRWTDIHQAILENRSTLKSFSVGGLSFGQIWDCAVFQNCTVLDNLSIEISHTHKINFSLLPSHLKVLSVFGPVQRSEIEAISDVLLSLTHLNFTHLGRISEFNEARDDQITLDVFKRVLHLPSLTSLSFTACSTISIDWETIAGWCSRVKRDVSGFLFYEKFSQLHGEYIRNGISVEITPAFKREEFNWDAEQWTIMESDDDDEDDEDETNERSERGHERPSRIASGIRFDQEIVDPETGDVIQVFDED
jgi:hypothetical protein